MPQQIINIGAAPNDDMGDPLRDAYDKCNQNFTELYARGAGGSTYQAVASNYAVGITPALLETEFIAYSTTGLEEDCSFFIVDYTPTACRLVFTQQEVNAANDGAVGFEISATADFATVLYRNFVLLGETKGIKTGLFVLSGLTGGTPYYIRWGYKNPTTLPILNIVGLSLVFY